MQHGQFPLKIFDFTTAPQRQAGAAPRHAAPPDRAPRVDQVAFQRDYPAAVIDQAGRLGSRLQVAADENRSEKIPDHLLIGRVYLDQFRRFSENIVQPAPPRITFQSRFGRADRIQR